ncbi:unnamed protein product [Arabidopsis thaliana]|uniref:Uncharacterized protein n=2 Tax=Arabidopsis thaliana TaxID=3702 RepID=A0A654G9G8_ARATH|nr:uncharacterized protein AT5G49645 [Arabidopsis thaliana]ANM71115.1 hypothetical protein AT5G49645 [Arabidopsis thaliana]VYS69829.1 unnamed protein product [Arabidopsis thaliana]|eukprot:NP_001336535.1 hypothetical protein AT5G49645 [Arabidopsis thaliana]
MIPWYRVKPFAFLVGVAIG